MYANKNKLYSDKRFIILLLAKIVLAKETVVSLEVLIRFAV